MPSYCIHLAVGNEYAKRNYIRDIDAFRAGVIAPDFAKDKEKSHYSVPTRRQFDFVEFLAGKVQLAEYLKNHDIPKTRDLIRGFCISSIIQKWERYS